MVLNPGSVGGTACVPVTSILAGIDWDNGKVLIATEQPVTLLAPEDVAAIHESVKKGHSWHAFKAYEKQATRIKELEAELVQLKTSDLDSFDLRAHMERLGAWSEQTFGPGERTQAVLAHIRKELVEIEDNPTDTIEWVDVVMMALDGARRAGATPDDIIAVLVSKQVINEQRRWPDWRKAKAGEPIEHIRDEADHSAEKSATS